METKTGPGLYLVISDDAELVSSLSFLRPKGMDVRVWVPNKNNQLTPEILEAMEGDSDTELVVRGDFRKPQFYDQWKNYEQVCVVLALKSAEKRDEARTAVLENLSGALLLSLHHGNPSEVPRSFLQDRELCLSWAELLSRPLSAELRHVQTCHRVCAIREVLDPADKIALLLQPDPDPDGLASALALRTILGRNKTSTPIVTFGKVTRPENIAMMKLLDIEVIKIKPNELEDFDRVALLDTQPGHFSQPLVRVDAIIDHHPLQDSYSEVSYVDIRHQYGATSTILVEYLKAAACPIGQRLATALIYGIKADTLHLNREVIDADLDAYVSLYPLINYNLLRRIEKPEIPLRFAPILAESLRSMMIKSKILVSALGTVEREDLIPQVADFLMQFEEIEWVVCAGVFEGQVILSVRNVGYVKSAGEVVKRVVQGIGFGGGHRTMAKGFIPLETWKQKFSSTSSQNIKENIHALFEEAIRN